MSTSFDRASDDFTSQSPQPAGDPAAAPKSGAVDPKPPFERIRDRNKGINIDVKGFLGSGAFTCVYRGHDKDKSQAVAVKVPANDTAHDKLMECKERLEREFKGLHPLAHKNLVRVDYFGHVGHTPYLVTEYIAGPTLSKWLADRNGRVEAALAIEICTQLLSGLGELHRANIVHRDIKPDNLMMTTDAEGKLVVKIIDLGIAKVPGAAAVTMAAGKGIIGTLGFLAPEQLDSTNEFTPATDVHGAGAVLYWLLTGRPPYGGSMVEALKATASTKPEKPSACLVGLNPRLDYAIMKALEKSPSQRFASAAEFAKELREIAAIPPAAPIEVPSIQSPALPILGEVPAKSEVSTFKSLSPSLRVRRGEIWRNGPVSRSTVQRAKILAASKLTVVFGVVIIALAVALSLSTSSAVETMEPFVEVAPQPRPEVEPVRPAEPRNDRAVAAWVLDRGGSVVIDTNGVRSTIASAPLDRTEPFVLVGVDLSQARGVTDATLAEHLAGVPDLAELELKGCTKVTRESVETIARLPGLRKLGLVRSGIVRSGFGEILAAAPNLEAVYLDVRHVQATADRFSKLLHLRTVVVVGYFSDKHVAAKFGSDELRDLATGPAIERIEFHGVDLEESHLDFRAFAKLKVLHFRNCDISDAALQRIAATPITDLSLYGCRGVTDRGVEFLERMAGLQTLDLGATGITDKALISVAKLHELHTLQLGSSLPFPAEQTISDLGLWSLAGLTKLQILDLRGLTRLTDPALRSIIPRMTSLQTLRLTGMVATPGFVESLAKHPSLAAIELAPSFRNSACLWRLCGAKPRLAVSFASVEPSTASEWTVPSAWPHAPDLLR